MQAVEYAIAAVAGVQDNIITWEQLLDAGLRRGAILHRASEGSLHRRHRGVYLVGHAPPTPMGRARAAVLACGAGAVASHRTAAELWGLLPHSDGDVDVIVVARNPGAHPGIKVHRVAAIDPAEVRQIRGLSVTSPTRTICDIAGTEPRNDIEHALQEARVHLRLTDAQLKAVIERTPTKKGSAFIRRLLEAEDDTGHTRSRAERLMRAMAGDAGLPQPQANVRLHGYLLDFVWRRRRLVVEVDGYASHGDRTAFERDRQRDQVLVAAGYRVVRVTWRQLTEEPYAVIARLAQALVVPAPA
jgi:very-short-patch-repair endonuclease